MGKLVEELIARQLSCTIAVFHVSTVQHGFQATVSIIRHDELRRIPTMEHAKP